MKQLCLYVFCLMGSLAEMASSNGVLPYPATILEGEGQVCPPEEVNNIARAKIAEDIRDIVRNYTMEETPCPGNQENPAVSCNEIAECNPELPSGNYWLNTSMTPVSVYCEMTPLFNQNGSWVQVAAFNITQSDVQCPDGLELLTSPRRMCRSPSAGAGCSSTMFSTHGVMYQKVCGRIIGYQYYSPDAFGMSRAQTIDDNYVDGISITHGHNPRKHIWTLAAALDEVPTVIDHVCPCTNTTISYDWQIPSFVGSDYYCETALRTTVRDQRYMYHVDDPLWDGEGCGPQSTCCEGEGKPWFCKDLTEVTTDDIEMRLCKNQERGDEDFPLEIIELYIQ